MSNIGVYSKMFHIKENHRELCLLVFITFLSYFNSLFNGFVWDDNIFILKDRAIIDFKVSELLFSVANGMEFIPAHSLTLAIDHLLWGFNPLGFHLTNISIYISSIITLYFVIINIPVSDIDKRKVAIWTSTVFALHPIHSEPVNFISNRCHLLACLFVLLSLYWFVKWLFQPLRKYLALSVLFFIFSLLSKQSAVAFPVLVVAVVLLYKNSGISLMQRIWAASSFILIDIVAVIFHIQNAFTSSTAVTENLISNSSGILNKTIKTVNIYSFYIHKYLFPKGLTLHYDDRYLHSGISIPSALSFVLFVIVLAFALYNRKRNILITAGIIWYSIMLVPAMNLLDTTPVIANRYALIPSIGLSLVIGYLIYRFIDNYHYSKHVAVMLVLIMATITITKNFDWKSDYTLFKSAVEHNPRASRTNYADALLQLKRPAEALATLKEEMDLTGSYNYYYYLGNTYAEKGNYQEAIKAYKAALMQNGDRYKLPHLALAKIYYKTGNDLNAIKEYLDVIDSYGLDHEGVINAEAKKAISALQGKFLPDIDRIKSELSSDDKNLRLLSEMAMLYQNIGMYGNAIEYYDRIIKVEPKSWIAWHNKALCFAKEHKSNDSIAAFEHSFKLNGKNVEALNQIGSIYMKTKDYTNAEIYFKKAVSVDQAHVFSVFNLARVYFSAGRKNDARKYFAMAVSLSGNSDSIKNRAAAYLSKL